MKVTLKEKAIVSSFTFISSLTGYFYARTAEKDTMPYIMIGGFVGALLGEAIAHTFCNQQESTKDNNNSKNQKQNGSNSTNNTRDNSGH